jgi:cobalt-zinc-cadmium efflux system membrane fusion protein
MSVWVAESDKRMKKRTVTTGLRTNGMVQITQGLKEGEPIASTGSIFLSNLLVVGE